MLRLSHIVLYKNLIKYEIYIRILTPKTPSHIIFFFSLIHRLLSHYLLLYQYCSSSSSIWLLVWVMGSNCGVKGVLIAGDGGRWFNGSYKMPHPSERVTEAVGQHVVVGPPAAAVVYGGHTLLRSPRCYIGIIYLATLFNYHL